MKSIGEHEWSRSVCRQRAAAGFTLIEMAFVMIIIGALMSSGMMLLGARVEQQKLKDTQKILDDAREALIGFAAANGRLPCPATATSNGVESPLGGGVCTNPYDGFLPAVTLGLPGVDAGGYLTDAWQTQANRLRYAVTAANGSAVTTTDGIKTATITAFSANADLSVCVSATNITGTTCGTATALTTAAVAVIFSLGKDTNNVGADQIANLNGDQVFVSHAPSNTAGNAYDDMVTWLSSSVLFNRMLQAGRLP